MRSHFYYILISRICKYIILTLLLYEEVRYPCSIAKQENTMNENLFYWIDAIWGRIKLMRKLNKYK